MEKENFVPFNDEWKKELMKWTKSGLIDFLKEKLIELQETKDKILKFNAPVESRSVTDNEQAEKICPVKNNGECPFRDDYRIGCLSCGYTY